MTQTCLTVSAELSIYLTIFYIPFYPTRCTPQPLTHAPTQHINFLYIFITNLPAEPSSNFLAIVQLINMHSCIKNLKVNRSTDHSSVIVDASTVYCRRWPDQPIYCSGPDNVRAFNRCVQVRILRPRRTENTAVETCRPYRM